MHVLLDEPGVVRARPKPNLLAEPRRPMALCRVRFGLCFGLGLASFAANTRQTSGEKAGGDIDFATFYILPVPSSLSAKWHIPLSNCDLIHCLPFLLNGYWDSIGKVLCEKNAR